MLLAGSFLGALLLATIAYFVIDNALKNESEGLKVFGAVLFTFLIVAALAIVFGAVYITVNGNPGIPQF